MFFPRGFFGSVGGCLVVCLLGLGDGLCLCVRFVGSWGLTRLSSVYLIWVVFLCSSCLVVGVGMFWSGYVILCTFLL